MVCLDAVSGEQGECERTPQSAGVSPDTFPVGSLSLRVSEYSYAPYGLAFLPVYGFSGIPH